MPARAPIEEVLGDRLREIDSQGLRRRIRTVTSRAGATVECDGARLVSFASNDYLGLASHPAVVNAAVEGARRHGAGSTASRLICGTSSDVTQLESTLADWKRTAAAITYANGFAAAMGTIPAIVGRGDVVILDRLAHACLVDAARASGATLRIFRHNDCGDLARLLDWAGANVQPPGNILIVTESVFSMDGDRAPLADIVELKQRHGAWLMLDEAHAVGWLGTHRSGLAEQIGAAGAVEIQMGTLGKAAGVAGGYIAGSQVVVDHLVNSARSFIFSTAPVPAQSAGAIAAIGVIRSDEGRARADQLRINVEQFRARRGAAGAMQSPIVPIAIGEENRAVALADALRAEGFWAPAVRFPTVPRRKARLRLSFTTSHTPEQIDQLATVLAAKMQEAR